MTDALAAIRAEKAFLKLSLANRDRMLAALFETQRHIEGMKQQEHYDDRAQRLRNRNALRAHLAPILKILKILKIKDKPVGGCLSTPMLIGSSVITVVLSTRPCPNCGRFAQRRSAFA